MQSLSIVQKDNWTRFNCLQKTRSGLSAVQSYHIWLTVDTKLKYKPASVTLKMHTNQRHERVLIAAEALAIHLLELELCLGRVLT